MTLILYICEEPQNSILLLYILYFIIICVQRNGAAFAFYFITLMCMGVQQQHAVFIELPPIFDCINATSVIIVMQFVPFNFMQVLE